MAHFDEACDLDAPGREALLKRLVAADPDLGKELAALLEHDQRSSGRDALDMAARELSALARAVAARTYQTGAASKDSWPVELPADLAPALQNAPQDIDIMSPLAEGGMGRVMLARQRSLQREVAVKMLRPEAASAHALEGLLSEALLVGSLEHPNIVPVHLLGRDPAGMPHLVMKRVEGVSWAALISNPDHPAWSRAPGGGGDQLVSHLSVLLSVCNALHFAHSRGVLHRDIKPDNVMVGEFGEIYLVDWGIARRLETPRNASNLDVGTGAGLIMGTPGFMAPEMVTGGPPDVRTDVYLLGATLHSVLVRAPRHQGHDLAEILGAATRSAAYSYGPDVPAELAAICNRATHADLAQRFPDVPAFRDATLAYLRHRDSIAMSTAADERLRRLRALLDPQPDTANGALPQLRRLHELMTESLFGFQQSLRAWPDNASARQGLRECLLTIIAYEIEQQNLPRAQALLPELDDPPQALLAQLAKLERHVRQREAREARLREIERGQDWRLAAQPRLLFFGLLATLWLVLFCIAMSQRQGPAAEIPPATLVLMAGLGGAGMAILVALFRRHLFATEVTRKLVLGILCAVGGMLVNRTLDLLPTPRTAAVVCADQVLVMTACLLGGVALARWFWLLAPIFLGGAVLSRLFPAHAGTIFVTALVLALAVGASAIYWQWRGPARGK